MKEPILLAMLLLMGFNARPQLNNSSAGRIKQAIEAMLPEGEIIADVMEDVYSTAGAEMKVTGKLNFSIASDGKRVWFYTYGASRPAHFILDDISINLESNTVSIDSIDLTYREDGLKNDRQVHSLRWLGKQSAGPRKRSYSITIRRLEHTGQTFMQIRITEITTGKRKSLLDLSLRF
ncbi:hypothetical protein [Parapedobacter pyrenivorans]|uniref:hypothetical protein n=1 Tax=Parapedobacter pyrenivorans TaxID=1305674 RepID=UPI003342491C